MITFRDRNEINALTAQLSVKRYVDNLRIMRHEQLNRMTTSPACCIWAIMTKRSAIFRPSRNMLRSYWILSLALPLADAMRSAARQSLPRPRKRRGAELRPGLPYRPPLPSLMESELISIIGNLLDNAIEATQRAELPHEPVEVLIQLNARELIIEVADRGVGIRPDIRERILNAASPPNPWRSRHWSVSY